MKTLGHTLLFIAVLLALAPVMIAGRGSQPSMQVYQDAKGSWMSSAYAYSNSHPFFVAASIVGLAGAGLVASSSLTRRHRRPSVPSKQKQE
jgi:hypothetical protein